MSYQIEFRDKGGADTSWCKWAQKYPTREALDAEWGGKGNVLNTDEFDFRIVGEADSSTPETKGDN